MTRAEYNESGSNACRRKFVDWKTPSRPIDDDVIMVDKLVAKDRVKTKGKARARPGEEDRKVSRSRAKAR